MFFFFKWLCVKLSVSKWSNEEVCVRVCVCVCVCVAGNIKVKLDSDIGPSVVIVNHGSTGPAV